MARKLCPGRCSQIFSNAGQRVTCYSSCTVNKAQAVRISPLPAALNLSPVVELAPTGHFSGSDAIGPADNPTSLACG